MKISHDLHFDEKPKAIKCPQCSSSSLESSSNIDIPEWQPGKSNTSETALVVSYVCIMCGHKFTSKDLESRRIFKQGMMTLFFIFIMIVLLLVVLL